MGIIVPIEHERVKYGTNNSIVTVIVLILPTRCIVVNYVEISTGCKTFTHMLHTLPAKLIFGNRLKMYMSKERS